MTPQTFPWNLTQDRVDCIAQCLYKLETILNIAAPGFLAAENVACLVTDLRAQVCAAGAEDPFPYMPMAPRFPDTIVIPNPSEIWGEEASMQ